MTYTLEFRSHKTGITKGATIARLKGRFLHSYERMIAMRRSRGRFSIPTNFMIVFPQENGTFTLKGENYVC